jgi:hypothetical protein
MSKLNLQKIFTFKQFSTSQSKLYRRKLALKIKKVLEDDTITDNETKNDEQIANEHLVS